MTYTVTYYAPDSVMGDTAPEDCERFRAWALAELERELPEILGVADDDVDVRVSDQESLQQLVITGDYMEWQVEEAAGEFAGRLWGRCPWDDV